MGATWESAVFRRPSEDRLSALTMEARDLARYCADPQVTIHFMTAGLADGRQFISAEMTALRRKRTRFDESRLGSLSMAVFGTTGLRFHGPEILIAEAASRVIEVAALYLFFSDTCSASGDVMFERGELSTYEMLGWDGSDTYLSDEQPSVSRRPDVNEVLRRAGQAQGWGLGLASPDRMFDLFYADTVEVRSYVLVEGRRLLDAPRLAP